MENVGNVALVFQDIMITVQGCMKLELCRRRNNAVSDERLERWSRDGELGLDVVIVDHVAT